MSLVMSDSQQRASASGSVLAQVGPFRTQKNSNITKSNGINEIDNQRALVIYKKSPSRGYNRCRSPTRTLTASSNNSDTKNFRGLGAACAHRNSIRSKIPPSRSSSISTLTSLSKKPDENRSRRLPSSPLIGNHHNLVDKTKLLSADKSGNIQKNQGHGIRKGSSTGIDDRIKVQRTVTLTSFNSSTQSQRKNLSPRQLAPRKISTSRTSSPNKQKIKSNIENTDLSPSSKSRQSRSSTGKTKASKLGMKCSRDVSPSSRDVSNSKRDFILEASPRSRRKKQYDLALKSSRVKNNGKEKKQLEAPKENDMRTSTIVNSVEENDIPSNIVMNRKKRNGMSSIAVKKAAAGEAKYSNQFYLQMQNTYNDDEDVNSQLQTKDTATMSNTTQNLDIKLEESASFITTLDAEYRPMPSSMHESPVYTKSSEGSISLFDDLTSENSSVPSYYEDRRRAPRYENVFTSVASTAMDSTTLFMDSIIGKINKGKNIMRIKR
mmetsp:Transcript_4197/g.8102  ORF Transcript_4197/g.8102 Transcript_4197/m.8102 type:complete len:492 (-) Transcript_4197:145-1620(-)